MSSFFNQGSYIILEPYHRTPTQAKFSMCSLVDKNIKTNLRSTKMYWKMHDIHGTFPFEQMTVILEPYI
jgi:hypothetical protein